MLLHSGLLAIAQHTARGACEINLKRAPRGCESAKVYYFPRDLAEPNLRSTEIKVHSGRDGKDWYLVTLTNPVVQQQWSNFRWSG